MSTTGYTQAGADASFRHGGRGLDEFTGATDDLKLAAAMSYAGAQTYLPSIYLSNRAHTFNTPLGQPYDGFTLIGPGAGLQSSAASKRSHNITLNTGGTPWITVTSATCYNVHIQGCYFVSTNNITQFASAPAGQVAWSWTLRDLSFYGFAGVLGTSSEQFACDLISIEGDCSVLHCLDTPFNIKGADVRNLWGGGMLNIGSGDAGPSSGAGGGLYLMKFNLAKAAMANVYLTADNGWRGIQSNGSQTTGYGFYIDKSVIEGRNSGSPCAGILLNVTGGSVGVRDTTFDMGLASPSGGENGYIQASGSDTQLLVDGCAFALGASPNTVNTPMVYASGAVGAVRVRVSNAFTCGRSGGVAWGSNLPKVTENITSGTGHLITADSSVNGP